MHFLKMALHGYQYLVSLITKDRLPGSPWSPGQWPAYVMADLVAGVFTLHPVNTPTVSRQQEEEPSAPRHKNHQIYQNGTIQTESLRMFLQLWDMCDVLFLPMYSIWANSREGWRELLPMRLLLPVCAHWQCRRLDIHPGQSQGSPWDRGKNL